MSAALDPGLLTMYPKHANDITCHIAFAGRTLKVSQKLYETRDFCVYELSHEVELAGQKEKYLALTCSNQLFSIDVLAGPKELLTHNHGSAWIAHL